MDNTTIAQRLCEAAEIDLGLPYSLMCDAWDLLMAFNVTRLASRERFEEALAEAIEKWDADQVGYQFNERSLI